jgi:hypothetical protein
LRYLHTNLIARDWQRLAAFYELVFGCVRVLPERHLSGESMERGSGVSGARIDGTIESVAVAGAGRITWTYARDPEGNIIELQRRDPQSAALV